MRLLQEKEAALEAKQSEGAAGRAGRDKDKAQAAALAARRSEEYQRKRREVAALRAELVTLQRTEQILRTRALTLARGDREQARAQLEVLLADTEKRRIASVRAVYFCTTPLSLTDYTHSAGPQLQAHRHCRRRRGHRRGGGPRADAGPAGRRGGPADARVQGEADGAAASHERAAGACMYMTRRLCVMYPSNVYHSYMCCHYFAQLVRQQLSEVEAEYADRRAGFEKTTVGLEMEKNALEKECDDYQARCVLCDMCFMLYAV
jgi:hypothetical protein